jgi:MFS family permease
VFGAVGGAGGAVGLLMGGALTELLNWRWCMFISLAFVLPAAAGAIGWLHHFDADVHPHLDIPGTVAGTLGLFALVYGFSHAASKGWSDGLTIGALAASVVLLALFVLIETRVAHPLLPLRILADQARATAFIALAIVGAACFGALLMLTYYLQQTLHYSPIKAGLAFLPLMVTYLPAANLGTRLLPRIGARTLLPAGMLLAGGSFAWLTVLGTSATYVTNLGLPFLVMGAGVGLVFPPALTMATFAVLPHDTGVASALVSAFNQIGASVGTALLSTVSATAAASYLSDHVHTPASAAASAVHGYTTGFWVSVAILLAGAVICVAVLPSRAVRAARAGQDTSAQQAGPVIV